MKNQTTKRVALAVHVNAEDGYVSKLYSWILPEDIQGLKRGDILEVENLDATSEVVFVAEKNVSAADYQGTKKVLRVFNYSLEGFFDGEWHSEIIKDFKNRIEVLARGITEHSYDHQEFRGGSLLDDWCELDPIYEKIEEVGGYKRSVKRIALCVYIDTRYNGVVSAFKEYPLAEDVQGLKTGDILTLNVMPEGRGELVFITEYEKNTAKQYEGKIIGVSNETLEETSFIYDSKEIKETLSLLAEGINSGLRATKEFSGYDLDRGWYSWDVEENEKIIEKRVAQKREELRKQRAEEAIAAANEALEREKMKSQREEYAIEFLQKFECSLEQLEKYEWYLRVEDDINDLTRMGLSVGIFCVGENSREELSPKWMQWDTLKINEEYMDGNDDRRPLSLCRRDYKKGAVNNPCSLKELHTPTTRYFEFGKSLMERTSLFIEVKYGDAKTCKIHATERDFVHVSRTASRAIERGTTIKEFEIGEYKLRFEELFLIPGEMNILGVRRGRGIPYPDTFFNPELFIEKVKRHLSDDGKCYTCQILSDGVWKTLGTTGKMVGSGYIKPYIFNASNNSIEEFDGKSYRIGRYNCGSGIHFSKYYDENRIGYCPGEFAEW